MAQRIVRTSAAEVIERFCLYLQQNRRSPVTIKNYRCDLEGLVRWTKARNKNGFSFDTFAAKHFLEYRNSLVHKFEPSTTNRKIATLNSFLRWAAEARLLNPIDIPRLRNVKLAAQPPSPLHSLDTSEQVRLMQAVRTRGAHVDIAAITLMLDAGLRVSELCALRWEDVTIAGDKGTLTLHRARVNGPSQVPLNKAARIALISLGYPHNSGKRQLVFAGQAGPMTRRGVEMMVQRYSRLAGLKNVKPLMLRHTFCENLLAGGVDPSIIVKLVGHGNLEARLYRELSIKDVKQTAGGHAATKKHLEHFKGEDLSPDSSYLDELTWMVAGFQGDKRDHNGGYTFQDLVVIAHMFHAQLEQASELLKNGKVTSAAVIAEMVLETAINKLCPRNTIADEKLERMIADSTGTKCFSETLQKRITYAINIRKRWVHEDGRTLETKDVSSFISTTKMIIDEIARPLAQ